MIPLITIAYLITFLINVYKVDEIFVSIVKCISYWIKADLICDIEIF